MQVTVPGQFNGSTSITIDGEAMTVMASGTSTTWPITQRAAKPAKHSAAAAVIGPHFTTWGQMAQQNLAIHAPALGFLPGDPSGMLHLSCNTDPTYPSYTLSALRQAYANPQLAGELDVSSSWLLTELQAFVALHPNNRPDIKWCVGRRPS